MGAERLTAGPGKLAEAPILVELDKSNMKPGRTPLVVGVYSRGRRLETLKTTFIGPRSFPEGSR
jgi:hypothetical protein